MNGMSMHGRRKTAGAATGGVLRLAVAASVTPHQQGTNQDFCEWTKWTQASTASCSTHPAALSICSAGPIPLAILPPGGTPLSEGGECLRTPHALNTVPIASTPSSQSTKNPEEPNICRFYGSDGKSCNSGGIGKRMAMTQGSCQAKTLRFPGRRDVVGRAVPARRSPSCQREWPEMCGRIFPRIPADLHPHLP